MPVLEEKEISASNESQRIELRSLVNLAGEPISHFWPMKTFIHHNPLHGLEHLPFEKAINEANRFFGGRGYLPNAEYRNYFRQGRITEEAVDEALKEIAQDSAVTIGGRKLPHQEILKTILIHGTETVAPDVSSALLQPSLNKAEVRDLREKIKDLLNIRTPKEFLVAHANREKDDLATQYTLGKWCDQSLGTRVQDQINGQIIKWCAGFLDEGHAPWAMPLRKKTFYGGWKNLVLEDAAGSILGIKDWKAKVRKLPDRPEDAILESLDILHLPKNLWIDYFSLHFADMSGWTGFIKWRSEQMDYEWQNAFPMDLIKYMAVRLFYEREFVAIACRDNLGIPGTYVAIQDFLKDHPVGYGLYKEFHTLGLPDEVADSIDPSLFLTNPLNIDALDQCDSTTVSNWKQIRLQQEADCKTLTVLHLLKSLNISLKDAQNSSDETLETLLDWIGQFPESQHGPLWLKTFESSFIRNFVTRFSTNIEKLAKNDESEEEPQESRPLSQSLFCIDVRSESFRRHLEEIGGNETFGFAGFFGIPLCYQGFTSEQQTDQCPVLLKPKHVVKEIPRAYQARAAEKFLEGHQLAKTGHTLLHDLKENVITPYIMVEAIGWFFGFRLFGQTLRPKWYDKTVSWIKKSLAIPIKTTLTVDKIDREEAHQMVATKHREIIYRLFIEKYGQHGATVPHDQVERLRKLALEKVSSDSQEDEELYRLLQWNESDLQAFIVALRKEFNITERDVDRRITQVTQTGFTVSEQAHFVETALRILGFTKTFARLVLFCAHGSTSDNNPYESALDCGACGGNHGISNARALAVMANKPEVRQMLVCRGLQIPPDTHFLPGQHDTTTDEVELYDLEDVPATHRKDLNRLQRDLLEAGEKNSRERLARFPDESPLKKDDLALPRAKERSMDWSQVRPEWGLSKHTAFIVGRRLLTQGINLEGRTFLHSYDYAQDPTGKYLEIIMTAPMIVGNWINMEHYFSTVDPEVYGSGSKVYHNVASRVGVMYGTESDLCVGLPVQTVLDGDKPYHEPMRLFTIIEAPLDRIANIVAAHDILQKLTGNQWINIVGLNPEDMEFYLFQAPKDWQLIKQN